MAALGYIGDQFASDLASVLLEGNTALLPSEYWIDASLSIPNLDGTGLILPDDPDYEPQMIPADAPSWTSLGVGSRGMASAIDVVFPEATVDWGTVRAYAVHDSLTRDRFVGYGILNPYPITAGGRAKFAAGTIIFRFPGL